jgi:Spy/CpxP family protein refolding chaperone
MTWRAAAALALLATTCQLPAAGQGGPLPRRGTLQRPELRLTPEQQQQLARLEAESRAESGRWMAQIGRLRRQLDAQYRGYAVDANRVRALHNEINQAQARLLETNLSTQLRLRAILSAEQFAALQAVMHERHGREHEHDDHRPGDQRERRR